ncbi:MAG: SRPBCC domain-containing protein [marine benthic group bacterium]|nr:SRPBCC domain-containing protein [Candidatus Carthagonibacter metallireducens]MCL7964105.1 SRPBCC domain-containing protein [Gemmatimonadota bacterium]MCL7966156.1 SRPBCC domain-containing protein [Gemmatimonadota bacterium]
MTVTLEKSFRVNRDREVVWRFLTDPANVAACLPGARLVQIMDERTFEGEVKLKLGPFGLVFRGLAHFAELDPESRYARLEASASELRGWGDGEMWMHSRLLSDEGATQIELEQSFRVSGRLSGVVATGLLRRAADFVLTRFASCVRSRIESEEVGET